MATIKLSIDLPRFDKVKLCILKCSSVLKLKGGIKFRVCNVCSTRLPSDLSDKHSEHLKTHDKQWNIYLIMMSKLLQKEIQDKHELIKAKTVVKDQSENEETSSNSDAEEEHIVYSAVDCLQHSGPRPPPLTTFELILMRKFTHDKNPVRKYREITDWKVAKQCNIIKFNKVVDELGDGMTAGELYGPNSEVVNKISRLICEKQCYYLPGECYFGDCHAVNFKDLMKKELHDQFGPHFRKLMKGSSEVKILQYNEHRQPKVYELCESIGVATKLEYNSEGYLDLNYDLFCKELWDFETPLFILEENKVLDTLLGLILAASEKFHI